MSTDLDLSLCSGATPPSPPIREGLVFSSTASGTLVSPCLSTDGDQGILVNPSLLLQPEAMNLKGWSLPPEGPHIDLTAVSLKNGARAT